ncbi:isoleucine--tRNA ligase [Mesomycoplasma lagogenitalium]|uniref:Isoleucine--tRNA ligase n=1 Tax=Mesomycoplasma lagogenitalium TaxID=171286 RepID=A0ABY8LTS1_9BACT|nr:isoleucine--tRNA ligase [Mesomycoplasma lagogenitalium]WGI36639.1 isoleucine--tRNA ligase [Mesomycoplasma lagogenitalium]
MEKQYKNTLNMPYTEFEMKANLTEKDEKFRKYWEEKQIYQKLVNKNKGKKQYVLHDGPPYANGDLHLGHALNKTIKDIIVRYKMMKGFYSPFINGWDTHGLPIELKMLQKLNKNHKDFSVLELRKEAEKYAWEQIEIQKEQMKKLQLLSDFKEIYVTLRPKFEAKQLTLLKKMALEGLLRKGLKPVYWSPSSQTALAEAEVEYAEHRSPSVYVSLKITKGNSFVNKGENLVIWTTTPWTLIANSGVAVGENFNYSRISVNENIYILATELIEKLAAEFKWSDYKILSTFKGKDLLNVEYRRPIKREKVGKVVLGHHVEIGSGTGMVHMAPLFGEDDFIIAKEYDLEFIMHVEKDGVLNSEAGVYEGMFYEDANKSIGLFLDEQKELLKLQFIKHSYPHDWRTKKPIIYRGTPQWFVSIDKFKPEILNAIEKIKVHHDWAKKRLTKMIENRNEWTISRQRSWGVPITIFYDENNEPVINEEVFDYVIDLVEKHGSNIWYEKETDELLPEKYRNKNWTREMDIMDVWFDSGSTSIAVEIEGTTKPFELYFEGSDQYRGWFNSSLINSVVFRKEAPYKELLSHGFIVDSKGQKMSKSLGNGVAPLDLISKYGADVLRLWIANSEYSDDVSYSTKIFEQNIEIYRKIRNTLKFLLGNINDFDYKQDVKLTDIHALIDERISNLKNSIIKNYDEHKFLAVVKEINNFIIDFSGYYLSIVKDALYADEKDSVERKMIQKNLYNLTLVLLIALSPIIPTTTEEAYSYINKKDKKESVHLEDFFEFQEIKTDLENEWKEFFKLKDEVYKLIEEQIKLGTFKRQNEAKVFINSDSEFIKKLDLVKLLMVGSVEFSQTLKVTSFDSFKCQRCWNHFEKEKMVNDICQRCDRVLKNER